MLRIRRLCGLLACLALSGLPAQAQTSPAQTVNDFYTARLQSSVSGAPGGTELLKYSSYLSPELVCLLGAGGRYSEQFAKSLPGDKPPFVEGDLYSSNFEIPTRFTAEPPQLQGSTARVVVHFFRDADGVMDDKGWRDEVKLNHVGGKRWLIEDIEYKGGFAFGNHGNLVAALRGTLTQPAAGSGWDARELDSCVITAPAKKTAKAKSGSKKSSSKATTKSATKKKPAKK